MCKHCANLKEDRVVVHSFFEHAVRRLNELLPKRIGKPLYRPITADDIAPVSLTINAVFWNENRGVASMATEQIYRMLMEMDDTGYYQLHRTAPPPMTDDERQKFLKAIEDAGNKP
jgi:hypothetical protein